MENSYDSICEQLTATEGAVTGKMFGMPCLKVNGKAFAGYYEEEMVFKLTGLDHKEALSLPGAHLFDPSGMNKPMKEWVQVPVAYADKWPAFAKAALQYVRGLQK